MIDRLSLSIYRKKKIKKKNNAQLQMKKLYIAVIAGYRRQ